MGKTSLNSDSAMFTVENAPIGIAHVDKWGKFLYVNRAYCEIGGWERDYLLSVGWPDVTHPEDIMPDSVQVEAVLRGEIPSYNLHKRYVTVKGDPVWVSLNVWGYFKDTEFQFFVVTADSVDHFYSRLSRIESMLDIALSRLHKITMPVLGVA